MLAAAVYNLWMFLKQTHNTRLTHEDGYQKGFEEYSKFSGASALLGGLPTQEALHTYGVTKVVKMVASYILA